MLRIIMLTVTLLLGSIATAADVSGPAPDFTLKSRSGGARAAVGPAPTAPGQRSSC